MLLLVAAISAAFCSFAIPDVFHAKIVIKSLVCDASKEYPTCERIAEVSFDKKQRRSRVLWLKDFEDVQRTYIRRHDLGREYELKTICIEGNICEKKCIRSELREDMEVIDLSDMLSEDQSTCSSSNNFILKNGLTVTADPKTSFISSVESKTVTWTIQYYDSPPPESHFFVPHSYKPKELCVESPNNNGFPYIRMLGGLLII